MPRPLIFIASASLIALILVIMLSGYARSEAVAYGRCHGRNMISQTDVSPTTSAGTVSDTNAQNSGTQMSPLLSEVRQIEAKVLGLSPTAEPIGDRMDAIEFRLYGKHYTGGLLSRLSRIRTTMQQITTPDANEQRFDLRRSVFTAEPKVITAMIEKTAIFDTPSTPRVPSKGATVGSADLKSETAKIAPSKNASSGMPTVQGALHSDDPQIVYEKAAEAYKEGKFAEAKKLFEREVSLSPRDPGGFYALGLLAEKEKEFGESYANFVRSWYLQPDRAEHVTALNELTDQLRHIADPQFKGQPAYSAKDPRSLLNAGVRLWKMGYTRAAISLFEWVGKNEPGASDDAYYNLGAIAEKEGDIGRALQYYRGAESLYRMRAASASVAGARNPSLMYLHANEDPLTEPQLAGTVASVTNKLHGGDKTWRGWAQSSAVGSSDVCPCFSIDRGERF